MTHRSFSSCAGRIRHPTGVVPAKGNRVPKTGWARGKPSRSREIVFLVCTEGQSMLRLDPGPT